MAGGRPRDARADEAILGATIELLAEEGYNGLSIDAVARRAGVARATVYRRWPSKAHLVHEAAFPAGAGSTVVETGRLADDLRAFVHGALAVFGRPEAQAAVPGLMAEFRADPALHALLADRLETTARATLRGLLARAVARGEARPDVDADALMDTVVGACVFGLIVSRRGDDLRFADRLTDLVLHAVKGD